MTAIAGFVAPRPEENLRKDCSTLLAGQLAYSSEEASVEAAAGAAFGIALFKLLPEDRTATAALVSNERHLLVADLRLDNREQIASRGQTAAQIDALSDGQILLNAWSVVGEAILDELIGDFALAVFDKSDRSLTLARDGAGQRPLFYSRSGDAIGFSSMPSGLLNEPTFNAGWDLHRLTSLVQMMGIDHPETYFAGVSRVLPGQSITLTASASRSRRFWNPVSESLPRRSFDEAVEMYRDVLGQAVKCRMRRQSGSVAVHLSSGYDSSAVAATAATVGAGPRLTAYTAAPVPEFNGEAAPSRSADESALAAVTARLHGMNHRVVHAADYTLNYLRTQATLYQDPLRNIINALWTDEIACAAGRDGATVLLNGMSGNMTLNAGGSAYLVDWLNERGLLAWWRQARAAAARGDVRWRSILFNSIAPWLPNRIWWAAWAGLRRRQAIPATFLRREWDVPTGALRDSAHGQPHRSTAEDRLFFVRSIDPAIFHKGGLAHAGVWEMEPLTDRRVVEFSLSLAPDQLIANGAYRPVARQALSDRLPTEVLDSKKRGMQSADWHLHFRKESAMAVLDEVETNATVQAVYDVPALREAAAAWPERLDRWDEGDYLTYASSLPFALNTAVFLMETEKGWSKPAAQQARRRAAGCKRG